MTCCISFFKLVPGAVARLDARPPGMWTVAGSILTSGNILPWSLAILSLPLIQEGQLSVTQEFTLSTGKLHRKLAQDRC